MKFPLVDATIFVDGYDLSGDVNNVDLPLERDALDSTTFGSGGWRERVPGLFSGQLQVNGWYDTGAGTIGEHTADNIGANRTGTTVTPTGADGSDAFMFQGVDTNLSLLGDVGSVSPFSLTQMVRSSVGAKDGKLLLPKQTITGNTDGTAVQMGTVAAGENVYTVIHCFTAGTTADVIVESDSQADFLGTPTERSSTTITATGGTWVVPVAGPITDDWWRVSVDTVTGSFVFAVAVAIA